MSEDAQPALIPGGLQGRGFWILMGYSVVLGLVGVVAALAFLGVTELGEDWYGETSTGWFDGHLWWIGVAAGAGLIVGVLRRLFHMPARIPGLIEDLEDQHIETRWVPSIVAVSAVSLVGGASLGPEVALGQMGGGAAELLAKRGGLDEDDTKSLTLAGMAGAFGGLFSSPVMTIVLLLEIARPVGRQFRRAFYGILVASSVSFGVYFAIAGTVFLGVFQVPQYAYEDWHLLAGVALGVLSAIIVVFAFAIGNVLRRVFDGGSIPDIAKPVFGGLIFGFVGFALPLTNFTGSAQLNTVLTTGGTLGAGLLISILIGKVVAFAVSTASGFIGGPIFPMLFIGGSSGVIISEIFPGIPLGLAFTCMLAAVPGAVVSAPLSMVLLAALFAQIGTLQTAPVVIAVGTAYLTLAGLKTLIAQRSRTQGEAGATSPPSDDSAV